MTSPCSGSTAPIWRKVWEHVFALHTIAVIDLHVLSYEIGGQLTSVSVAAGNMDDDTEERPRGKQTKPGLRYVDGSTYDALKPLGADRYSDLEV